MRVAVLGCGNWGTTLGVKLAGQGHSVKIWEHDRRRALKVQQSRYNELFLPGVRLDDNIEVSSSISAVLAKARAVLVVLPTPVIRDALAKAAGVLPEYAVVISASKGIEYETGARISRIIQESLGLDPGRIAVLSGPNLAWEIVKGMPSSAVAASYSPDTAVTVQRLLSTSLYRVYTSSDVVGVELGGALKNIIAIASGIVNGLGFGDNTKSALITRGLAEIARFGVRHGADPLTFIGLSGLGDLVATCSSTLSRNYRCGRMLAQGKTLSTIRDEMKMVAEGINTTRSIYRLARGLDISMPITAALYKVLYEQADVRKSIEELMTRSLRREDEFSALAKKPSC